MHLNRHSLQQIDAAYIQSLEPEALRNLSVRLLADLKEAWDRLNQGPDNSSRPLSSRAPWERTGCGSASADDTATSELMPDSAEAKPVDVKPVDGKPGDGKPVDVQPVDGKPVDAQPTDPPPKRQPGKQPGAPGFGRTQVFHAHEEQGITRRCARGAVSRWWAHRPSPIPAFRPLICAWGIPGNRV